MENPRDGLLAQEFADLCGVSKDTLLYYDKIGLFSPEMVAENGYRVYSLDQVHTFDLLLLLRDSHLPLKQIKTYLHDRHSAGMLALIQQQAASLKDEIAELNRLYQRLETTATRMAYGMDDSLRDPHVQICEEKYYVVVPVTREILQDRKRRMAAVRTFLHACRDKGLQGDYLRGAVISKDRLLEGCFEKEYFCVGVAPFCDTTGSDASLLRQPEGLYAIARHYGSYQDLPRSYEKLIDYIHTQGLRIQGNAYETELMGYICEQNDNDYMIEIAIEVGRP